MKKNRSNIVLIVALASLFPLFLISEPDGDVDQNLNKLRSEKIESIYNDVRTNVLSSQELFTDQITTKLKEMGPYSASRVKELNDFLVDSLKGFVGSMGVIERTANANYYLFLEENDMQSDDPRDISPDERLLFHGVHSITSLAILHARSLILAITSKNDQAGIGERVAQALKESDVQAKKDYEEQLAANEKEFNRSRWQAVKDFGSDFVSEFSNEFNKEVKKEVLKQVEGAAEQLLGKVGAGVIDLLKPLTGGGLAQLNQLPEKLNNQGLAQLESDNTDRALELLKSSIRVLNPSLPPVSPVFVHEKTSLGKEEMSFLNNRLPKVQKALSNEFGIDQPLKISWCFGGGGVRAMFATHAMLASAAKHKILDASIYMAGLSGSTWMIAPWCYLYLKGYLSKNLEISFQQVLKSLEISLNDDSMFIEIPKVSFYGPPLLSVDDYARFSSDIAMRFGFNQPITVVDVFGAFIGGFALQKAGKKRLDVTWSSICKEAQYGITPWPLCSSTFELNQSSLSKSPKARKYEWFEMSPSQAGSPLVGYVPVQYVGSKFQGGKLVTSSICPEYSMAFFLGMYGSAFAALSPNVLIEKKLKEVEFTVQGVSITIPVDKWVKAIMDEAFGKDAGSFRHEKVHAQFSNYSQGLQSSVLQNESTLGMFDAGGDFNFPLPLLFDRPDRTPDIVFIVDSNNQDAKDLKVATSYFKLKGIDVVPDMSKVTADELLASAMTVFNDPRDAKKYNKKASTIIYFPTRDIDTSMSSPFFTMNFKYNPEQIAKLTGNVSLAFESQVPEIKNIFKLVAEQKYGVSLEKPDKKIRLIKKVVFDGDSAPKKRKTSFSK
ncbi:MAG: hypothetical protein NTU89_00235 [Candidatus Dependentiae bacterium]|nr:hypothetical protein [Candidatus Dependentiae bacterium]